MKKVKVPDIHRRGYVYESEKKYCKICLFNICDDIRIKRVNGREKYFLNIEEGERWKLSVCLFDGDDELLQHCIEKHGLKDVKNDM